MSNDVKSLIQTFAARNNLAVGVRNAADIAFDASIPVPFLNYTAAQRKSPRALLPSANSIIVLALPYPAAPEFCDDGVPRGHVAAFAVPEDYHRRVKRLLKALAGEISSAVPHEYKLYADTGPLPEKIIARDCGLGHIGKNSLLINPRFGSMLNIGLLLTSLVIPPDAPDVTSDCGACTLCAGHCPGKAIDPNGKGIDCRLCVSYITQDRDAAPERLRTIGKWVYGCDVCQNVCPCNAGVKAAAAPYELYHPDLNKLADCDAELLSHLKTGAAGWIGAETLSRNASAALLHMF